MGTTAKIIYSSVLTILIISLFLIFYMQKSAQLVLDKQGILNTVAKQEQTITEIKKTLQETTAFAENAQKKNARIPELSDTIAAIEKEKSGYQQQLNDLQGQIDKQQDDANARLAEFENFQTLHKEQKTLLNKAKEAKLASQTEASKIMEQLDISKSSLEQREVQLEELTAALEEKDQAIAFYSEQLEASTAAINLSKAEDTTRAMNLTLILDELVLKTQLVSDLQDRIQQLSGSTTQPGSPSASHNGPMSIGVSEINALIEQMNQKATPSPADSRLPKAIAHIKELELSTASLQSTINEQSARIHGLLRDLETKQNTNAVAQEQVLEQQMANKALSDEVDRLQLVEEEAGQTLTQMQILLNDREEELVRIAQQSQEVIVPLTEQISSLELLLTEAGEQISLLTENITLSETNLTDLQTANDSLNKELEPAKSSLEETQLALSQTQEELAAMTAQYTALEAELNNTNEQQTSSIESAQKEADLLKNKIEQLSAKLTEKEETIENLTSQIAANDGAEQEQKISQLVAEVAAATVLSETLTEEHTALIVEKETAIQGLLEQQTSSNESAQKEIDLLKNEIEQLSAKLTEEEETNETLNSQIAANDGAEQEQKMSQLVAEVAAATVLSETLTEEHATLIAEKETAIQSLTTELDANKAQLAAVEVSLEEARVQQSSEENAKTTQQEELARLSEAAATAKTATDEQKTLLDNTKEQLTVLEEKIKDLENTLSANQDNLMTSLTEVTTLQASVSTLTAERNRLQLMTSDTDNDGVSDAEDTCPDTVEGAKVNKQGCEEDNDGDSMVNRLDLCPDTPSGSAIDSSGCSKDQTTVVLEGISFQFGTAELAEAAHPTLDRTAAILQSNPDLNLEIAGHTDSIGEKKSNLQLSTQRAQSVLNYMVSKGVSVESLQAKGYGAEEPIADNTSNDGRAKNRRVELRRIDSAAPQQESEETATPETTE